MKVGDYVRTNKGYIARIKKITELTIICDGIIYPTKNYGFDKQLNKESLKRLQVKSSPNIIDLIEVGDYVNDRYVDKYQGKLGNFCELPNGKWEFIEIPNEHYLISSIVTKEQFKSMEYKI